MLTENDSMIDAEQLSIEHSILAREQYEALQKYSYLMMSAQEADAYDKRRLRIGEICRLLDRLRAQ